MPVLARIKAVSRSRKNAGTFVSPIQSTLDLQSTLMERADSLSKALFDVNTKTSVLSNKVEQWKIRKQEAKLAIDTAKTANNEDALIALQELENVAISHFDAYVKLHDEAHNKAQAMQKHHDRLEEVINRQQRAINAHELTASLKELSVAPAGELESENTFMDAKEITRLIYTSEALLELNEQEVK